MFIMTHERLYSLRALTFAAVHDPKNRRKLFVLLSIALLVLGLICIGVAANPLSKFSQETESFPCATTSAGLAIAFIFMVAGFGCIGEF